MHEHTFIQSILDNIKDQQKVIAITLEIGELAGIEPEHLSSHIKQQTDWNIKTTTSPALVKCECGYKGKPKITQKIHDLIIFECPMCGQLPKVIKGDKIKIIKITYK